MISDYCKDLRIRSLVPAMKIIHLNLILLLALKRNIFCWSEQQCGKPWVSAIVRCELVFSRSWLDLGAISKEPDQSQIAINIKLKIGVSNCGFNNWLLM